MAIAVIGGLVLSTALSLVVVPAFYVIAEKVKAKRKNGAGSVQESK
jgi:Cu/Ag efflux pump CusA